MIDDNHIQRSMLARRKILLVNDPPIGVSFLPLDGQQVDRVATDDSENENGSRRLAWASLQEAKQKERDLKWQREKGEREKERERKRTSKRELVRQPYVTATLRRYPRRILSSMLIAASVIQAEDKRARNKIRTGSTGLPYSPSRALASQGSMMLASCFPALSGEKEAISLTFPRKWACVFPVLWEKAPCRATTSSAWRYPRKSKIVSLKQKISINQRGSNFAI